MPIVPWRVACQSFTMLDPASDEPALTVTFDIDHNRSDVSRLRLTPTDTNLPAYEIEFSAGGLALGQGVYQERWLRPFERVDPNFYLDDDDAAAEHAEGLDGGNGVRARYLQQREALLQRRDGYKRRGEPDEAPSPDAPQAVPVAKDAPAFSGRPKR